MNESILSHTFSNGLVLVAEPLPSLESAAFTFLVPAGCVPPATGSFSVKKLDAITTGAMTLPVTSASNTDTLTPA